MSENFKIQSKCGDARVTSFNTKHGKIETPIFMPVGTAGTVKAIFPTDLLKLDFQIILANTYHLMLRPGENIIRKMGGIQKYINWNRPILTDSGGFQIWSLSNLSNISESGIKFSSHIDGKKYFMSPEKSILIQEKLNSDISMVLDECTEFPATFERSKKSMEMTLRWANRCKKAFKKKKGFKLFGIIQGGMYKILRRECVEKLLEIDFDGYAIGGLSVGESHNKMLEVIESTVPFIPNNKPRYLMGVGRPVDIIKAVERGVDMFDCVIPTRFGRNGRAFTSEGEINLRNTIYAVDEQPLDESINCHVSKSYSRSYIHHLTKSNEILSSMILSLHNIAFYKKMMSDIKESIINNSFEKLKKLYLEKHEKYKKN